MEEILLLTRDLSRNTKDAFKKEQTVLNGLMLSLRPKQWKERRKDEDWERATLRKRDLERARDLLLAHPTGGRG